MTSMYYQKFEYLRKLPSFLKPKNGQKLCRERHQDIIQQNNWLIIDNMYGVIMTVISMWCIYVNLVNFHATGTWLGDYMFMARRVKNFSLQVQYDLYLIIKNMPRWDKIDQNVKYLIKQKIVIPHYHLLLVTYFFNILRVYIRDFTWRDTQFEIRYDCINTVYGLYKHKFRQKINLHFNKASI